MPVAGSGDRAAAAAVLCFQEWLGLDATDSQHALISPGELWSSHRQLFDQLLAALGCEDEGTLEDLRETLAMLLGKRICVQPSICRPHISFTRRDELILGSDNLPKSFKIGFRARNLSKVSAVRSAAGRPGL